LSHRPPPTVPDLVDLEQMFQQAFATGREGELDVIGYGEISSVVRWETDEGPIAAKRLPNYATAEQRRAHLDLMREYIEVLGNLGVEVLPTRFEELDAGDGSYVAYAIQAFIEPQYLVSAMLSSAPAADAERLLGSIIRKAAAVASHPMYGLDTQLSNWVNTPDGLRYLDITTPFMRDEATGLARLDTSIFVASLPWLLRWPVQRFLAEDIVAQYFDLRTTLIDTIANLTKEKAADWIPKAVDLASQEVDDPITIEEVGRYYRKDRRLWAVLQRLRRLDRWWQLRVRRQPYPVLLPGPIER